MAVTRLRLVLGARTRLCDCLSSMLRLHWYSRYKIQTYRNFANVPIIIILPMVWPSIVISVTVLVRQLMAKRLSPLEPMQTPVADRPSRPSLVMWSMKSRLGVSILILELPVIRNGQFHQNIRTYEIVTGNFNTFLSKTHLYQLRKLVRGRQVSHYKAAWSLFLWPRDIQKKSRVGCDPSHQRTGGSL